MSPGSSVVRASLTELTNLFAPPSLQLAILSSSSKETLNAIESYVICFVDVQDPTESSLANLIRLILIIIIKEVEP